MLIRRENSADAPAIRAVHAAAFADPEHPQQVPAEVGLIDQLRASDAWIPELALVALDDEEIIGHVICTRGHVGDVPALALGPIGVPPTRQRRGTGSALMHAVLGAAEARSEPLVALLGHLDYYPRFGFVPASEHGITPPVPEWAPHFQVRTLSAHDPRTRGEFAYPKPFTDL